MTANPGCLLQIGKHLDVDVPLLHPVQLIDASIRGVPVPRHTRASPAFAGSCDGAHTARHVGVDLAAYQQQPNAIGGSLGLSALVSLLPLAVVLVLLGGFKVRAQWAALAGLVDRPAGRDPRVRHARRAWPSWPRLHGAFYGLFPIMWIVVNALWIFNMTVATGHFDVLRRSFGASRPTRASRRSSSRSASARCWRRWPASARRSRSRR